MQKTIIQKMEINKKLIKKQGGQFSRKVNQETKIVKLVIPI
jgi:hypothetical protein